MKNFTLLLAMFVSLFVVNTASAQIQANFTYQIVTDSCDSWELAFVNTSTSSAQTSYSWSFSNGNTATGQTPPLQWFSGSQTHFGTLEIYDSLVMDTSIITIPIQLFANQPVVSTAVTPINPGGGSCNGQDYIFQGTNISTAAQITLWEWFVDGNYVGSGPAYTYTFPQAGTYVVDCYATAISGCWTISTQTVAVTQGSNLSVLPTYNIINSNCSGALVDLFSTVNGGTAPYTYSWSWYDFGNSTVANPQQVGLVAFDPNVYLTVTDANGCTATTQMFVNWNTSGTLAAGIGISEISSNCNDTELQFSGTGGATVVAWDWVIYDGCNNTYQHTIQNPVFNVATACSPVTAVLTVYDANNCSETVDYFYTLTDSSIAGYVDVDYVGLCSGNNCDATATITATNGSAPFTYSIDQGATFSPSNVFTNLCDGVYEFSIQDASACVYQGVFTVSSSTSPLIIEAFEFYENCDSSIIANGSFIQTTITGGVGPYTYLWNTGETTASLFNMMSGTYSVIVTDANGCTVTETFIVPANECYTISGNVYVDLNGDCILDSNEVGLGNVWVDLADSNGNWLWIYDYTDASGEFSISAPAGTYYFDVNGWNLNGYVQNCPGAGFTVTVDAANPSATVDFFMAPPPPTQDLSVSIGHITNVAPSTVPGQNRWSYIQFCNDGTIPMSGIVEWHYSDELIYAGPGYTNIIPDIIDQVNHTLTFNFSNLQPGNCEYVRINFDVPNTMQIGTIINDEVVINPIPGDVTPANNTAYSTELSVGSWDPNDKAVYPAGDITVDDNDHDYHIRFQNEGNANATRVIVRDVLDSDLVLHTLRNVNASHSFVLTIENDNELVFTFDNIQLPPKDVDEAGSQGYVSFSISQAEDVQIGETVENTAAIYFDFNEAVITNTVVNTIVEKSTAIEELVDIDVDLYPNPTTGKLQVDIDNNYEIVSVSIYDVIGNEVFNRNGNTNNTMQLDVSGNAPGIYFIKIATDEGNITKRFVLDQR